MDTQRMVAVLTVLLLLASGAAAQVAKAPDQPKDEFGTKLIGDGLIVPGQRIGSLRLTMTIQQILPLMPRAYKREVFAKQKVILYEWQPQGLWVSLDEDTKAVRLISVFGSGAYKTDKGVQLLHPEAKMREIYGKETKRYEYPDDRLTLVRYVPLGLQFGLVNQPGNRVLHGRIFTIGIFMPGKEPPLTKAPSN